MVSWADEAIDSWIETRDMGLGGTPDTEDIAIGDDPRTIKERMG